MVRAPHVPDRIEDSLLRSAESTILWRAIANTGASFTPVGSAGKGDFLVR